MRTTWKVTEVRMVEGRTTATLVRGLWFKRNPAFDEQMARYKEIENEHGPTAADMAFDDEPTYEEFLDLDAPEADAEWIDVGDGSLTLDITDGITMVPGDGVAITLDVLDRVPA